VLRQPNIAPDRRKVAATRIRLLANGRISAHTTFWREIFRATIDRECNGMIVLRPACSAAKPLAEPVLVAAQKVSRKPSIGETAHQAFRATAMAENAAHGNPVIGMARYSVADHSDQ
jgi:hypothetical protein